MNLIHGECLGEMRKMPDSSFDMILTDPPYMGVKSNDWDNQWSDKKDFIAWIGELSREWRRLLKPNGSLYCFAWPKMAARVELEIGRHFNVLNSLTWDKAPSGGWAKRSCKEILRSFFTASEKIIFAEQFSTDNFAKGEAGYAQNCDDLRGVTFEPLRKYLDDERESAGLSKAAIGEAFRARTGNPKSGMASHWFSNSQWALPTKENYLWLRRLFNDEHLEREYEDLEREYEDLKREYEDLRREYEDLRRPFHATKKKPYTDVFSFAPAYACAGKHPCEKPIDLLEFLIEISSKPGANVLDCFMGSGTTGAACIRKDREFTGIELDEKYFQQAKARLEMEEQKQNFLR